MEKSSLVLGRPLHGRGGAVHLGAHPLVVHKAGPHVHIVRQPVARRHVVHVDAPHALGTAPLRHMVEEARPDSAASVPLVHLLGRGQDS